jgi:lysophospholipase L1-like esterase
LQNVGISFSNSDADITKNNGGYVNATHNPPIISSLESYWYSDIYSIHRGDKVTVTSKDPSGSVVARISKWTQDGTLCLGVIETGTTDTTTVSYTAEDAVEYLRFSGLIANTFVCVLTAMDVPDPFTDAVENVVDDKIDDDSTKQVILTTVDDAYIKPNWLSVSMFDTIAVCGDSYTAGAIYNGETLRGEFEKASWGKTLGKLNGLDVNVYAQGGATTETFITRNSCLPSLLADTASDLYILALGINDYNHVTLGTIADIHEDYTDNPNTFYGNYGRIIAQIKAHAPNAKIIIVKVFIPTLYSGVFYNYSSSAIEAIANKFSIPYIDTKDDGYFSSSLYVNNILANSGHPTAPTYSGIAVAMDKLISKCIKDNLNYFVTYTPSV